MIRLLMLRNSAYRRCDPRRPVDWRWQLAEQLVAGGCHLSKHEDQPTADAVQYVRRLQRCTRALHHRRLAERMADVAAAHRLHSAGGWQRVAAEARLLTGKTLEEIAPTIGLSTGAIACYGSLFFDVREHLAAHGYIWTQALRSHPGNWPAKYDVLAKKAAFFGGAVVGDLAIAALDPAAGPPDLTTTRGRALERVQIWAILERFGSDPETASKLVRIAPYLLEELEKLPPPRSPGIDSWGAAAAAFAAKRGNGAPEAAKSDAA